MPYRASRVEQFDTILGSVAHAFAHHANADFVSVSHVDDAYAAISKCQLARTPWYKASEFFASFGALLVGVSFSLVNLLARILPAEGAWPVWLQVSIWASLFIFGSLIWLVGWLKRGALPKRPVKRTRWKTCWPILQCPRVDDDSDGSAEATSSS
jgi:hypothetical protein